MGPFGLTTIGNIQALSPSILTVICPSGAPIDGSRCFMAQCDACVRLQGQIPPPPARALYITTEFSADVVEIYRMQAG